MLLFPADMLRPRRVDDHFAPEAEAARELGVPYALVDHDALTSGDAARGVAKAPEGEAVYRGWMLPAEQYEAFATALAARGATLRTTATQYRTAHELPGWHEALAPVTPEAAWRVASRFLELRDEDFTGGFVLRRFEPFTGAEVRTWWRDGECRLSGPPTRTIPSLAGDGATGGCDRSRLAANCPRSGLTSPGASARRREVAGLRPANAERSEAMSQFVELGDGQVSERPATMPAAELIAAVS